MLLTLDSSVIVAAVKTDESFHGSCQALLGQVDAGHHQAIEPLTVLVEVVAAIRRRTGSRELAARVHRDLTGLPALRFVELDRQRAAAASRIGEEAGLRGMDAIVVQVAQEFGASLVTLDEDMVRRARNLVDARGVTDL